MSKAKSQALKKKKSVLGNYSELQYGKTYQPETSASQRKLWHESGGKKGYAGKTWEQIKQK